MQTFTTPMMKQYLEIKKNYQDCLLFYRMGDFYEFFLEDATIGAQVLNITLTSRPKGKDGRIPMAGVPFHAVDVYVAKLVKAGYKVAICEQMSPPNTRGIIKREVIRIVTPGTMLDEKALEKKENNYIISLFYENDQLALAIADISTGYFAVKQVTFQQLAVSLQNELAALAPSECILSPQLYNDGSFLQLLKRQNGMNIFCFQDWEQFASEAKSILKQHFGLKTLAGFGIDDQLLLQQTAAALIGYLQQTQKTKVIHIKRIEQLMNTEYVQLDRSTIFNLELFSTLREHNDKGSFLSVIDQTETSMGGRLLKFWLRTPLYNKEKITARHDAVEELLKNQTLREEAAVLLRQIADIERIISRLSVKIGNARDLVNLKLSLQVILQIKKILAKQTVRHPEFISGSSFETKKMPKQVRHDDYSLLQQIEKNISNEIEEVVAYIEANIAPEPPIDLRIGGMIRSQVNTELDALHKTIRQSKTWMEEYEAKEREKIGIGSLKVRFNSVFGYYIEVSKSNLALIPDNYQRKQTLVNGERFMTVELKKQEEIVLRAEEKMKELEYELFWQILDHVLSFTQTIQTAANAIAQLDCLLGFAALAQKRNYVRAQFSEDKLELKAARHSVVETLLTDTRFVPNDLILESGEQSVLLITGPNMAGKSVFIRQVALIVLLNQIGSFVPAEGAKLPLVDRIFVRSGASDVITEGLSTFMVEMVETAYILYHATQKSLIVMDEIGRGTSTYDGISIAWAVAEYLATHFPSCPKTLFATHYHELQQLEEKYPGVIVNYHMATDNQHNQPTFLYTLMQGAASHSFGIAVAKLAGVPEEVVQKADKKLQLLEQQLEPQVIKVIPTLKSQPLNMAEHLISKELQAIDISQVTPLEALNKLAELKEQLRMFDKPDEFAERD
ncbi:MAG TPA: DNA mismatch repair protein MutS [Patescibacteria group bacterium]|nr:DNA mismatch repair protein MutS [Patescibacteria group bacterium]